MNIDIDYLFTQIANGNENLAMLLNNPKEFPTEIIEKLSIKTAIDYWNHKIDYSTGDDIMNYIFGFWVTDKYYFENYAFPEVAWDCFNAFDAGEYYHSDDDRNIDPVEKYTNPAIEELLRDKKLID